MVILVINCGSSSLKYQLLNMDNEKVIAKGLCERIGQEGSRIKHSVPEGKECILNENLKDHSEALDHVIKLLVQGDYAVIKEVSEIAAVGHRVVHGGSEFTASSIVTEEAIQEIEFVSDFAPLHNPAAIMGIRGALKVMNESVPQVAVFDTAFHQTMPEKAYMYGVPFDYYKHYGVRRYGFHGSSHRFVSQKAAQMLGKNIEDLKIVICHLGNGSSICAVNGGKSVDTSMGFSPLPGLLMGTRSGDLDPTIIGFISEKLNISAFEVISILNSRSGLLGVSGVSADNRDVREAADSGNKRARLALEMLDYQIIKYIGAYAAAMNGIDVLVFTGGIGENDGEHREDITNSLSFLGLTIDKEKNKKRGTNNITAEGAKVSTLVVETNEELMIAIDTLEIAQKALKSSK